MGGERGRRTSQALVPYDFSATLWYPSPWRPTGVVSCGLREGRGNTNGRGLYIGLLVRLTRLGCRDGGGSAASGFSGGLDRMRYRSDMRALSARSYVQPSTY